MDYSDLDYTTINVYTFEKEPDPLESEDNVYMNEPPEEVMSPVQEPYYLPYIFRIYE